MSLVPMPSALTPRGGRVKGGVAGGPEPRTAACGEHGEDQPLDVSEHGGFILMLATGAYFHISTPTGREAMTFFRLDGGHPVCPNSKPEKRLVGMWDWGSAGLSRGGYPIAANDASRSVLNSLVKDLTLA